MPTPIAIEIEAGADLSGVQQTRSALDQFNREAQSGFKQTSSALDQMTAGGIMGFENMRRKVAELRVEYANNRQSLLDLRNAYAQGTISQAEFTSQAEKLTQSITASKFAMQTARQEMGAMTMQASLAMEPMRMMGESFGVRIPAGMGIMLARIPALQTAMEGLFNASIIAMFVHEGIKLAGEFFDYMDERISKMGGFENYASNVFTGKVLAGNLGNLLSWVGLGFQVKGVSDTGLTDEERKAIDEHAAKAHEATQRLNEQTDEIVKVNHDLDQYDQAIQKIELTLEQQLRSQNAAYSAEYRAAAQRNAAAQIGEQERQQGIAWQAGWSATEDQLYKTVNSGIGPLQQRDRADEQQALKGFEEYQNLIREMTDSANQHTLDGERKVIQQIEDEENKRLDHFMVMLAKKEISQQQYDDLVVAAEKDATTKIQAEEAKREQKHQQLLDRVSALDDQALAGYGNKYAAAIARNNAEAEKQFEQLKKMYGDDERNFAALEQAKTDLAMIAAERNRQVVEQYGQQLESLYDRLTNNVHNAGDFMKNVWTELKNWWKKQIFDQIAAWLLDTTYTPGGVGGMGGGMTAGASGGPLGAVLGGMVGMGGAGGGGIFGGGSGMVMNMFPGSGPLGITGGGAGAATAQQAGMGNLAQQMGMPATTPIGSVLSKLSQMTMTNTLLTGLGMGGVMLGSSIGGVGGALLGAGGGALAGFEIGSMFGPIGSIIGAAGGAIIGGLMSIFGGGSGAQKVHDTQIQQAGEQQMFQILDDFKHWRTDYATAVNNEYSIYNQMVSQFQRSQSKDIPTVELNNILADMASVQSQRTARQQALSMTAVPEFAEGGPTGMGGPAILHPGEFVMTQQAVNRIGSSVLAGLNSPSGSSSAPAEDGYVMQLWVASKEQAADIVNKGLPIVVARGGPASRMLRS